MGKFCLSNKIGIHREGFRCIEVKNVKQFIRELKENRSLMFKEGKVFFIEEKELDALVGKGLI